MCGYELSTNLQNFTQKFLTKVKIVQKVLGGGLLFLNHPVHCVQEKTSTFVSLHNS